MNFWTLLETVVYVVVAAGSLAFTFYALHKDGYL